MLSVFENDDMGEMTGIALFTTIHALAVTASIGACVLWL